MPIYVPSSGEVKILNLILNGAAQESLSLRLYSNNVFPGNNDVVGTYTQVTGSGYAAKTLTLGSWVVVAGAPSSGTYPLQTFEFTGPITSFGYFIVGVTSGTLYWAERFMLAPFFGDVERPITVEPRLGAD